METQRGIGAVAIHMVYVYCHGHCGVQGYSDRGVLVQWQYTWCTCTATVTAECRDTLAEGSVGLHALCQHKTGNNRQVRVTSIMRE